MEKLWRNYYSAMFRNYSYSIFDKMWGSSHDEEGEEYCEIYKKELEIKKDSFVDFMYLFNKYNLKYNRDSLALKIIELFEDLGTCSNQYSAYFIADRMLNDIDNKIAFNIVSHPLASKVK